MYCLFSHLALVNADLHNTTFSLHDPCTLCGTAAFLGDTSRWGETRACSQTSRTNNGTLTISTPLWVTQMRGLRNLYLSYPPLSLWVTLVYIHPLRVTLVYFHPLRVTLVYFHPLRVTLVYFHPLRVTLVYFHPLRVTLVYFHPPRVTLVYIHPPRVTHMFSLRNPW